MAFIDQRLPTQVEIEAIRRDPDNENVEIIKSDGGSETRNLRTSRSYPEYDISFPTSKRTDSVYTAVRNAYRVARGPTDCFRFRDWSNYQLALEQIGVGDAAEAVFQITQTFTFGASTFVDDITLPVSGSLHVFVNDVEQMSGWSCDYSTGIITFDSPPTATHTIKVTCDFDRKVRFDGAFVSRGVTKELEHIETLTLIEVDE